ncbi:acyltransferase family protein [Flavivirga aquimarina]|uniref:Acyltransferase family protein n=1 Tax=Flavivirga aquimarina TaxID=2027862 RepID=A0ABT8W7V8_9FLAO|nr:acyltransferase family protein [Flavivirga aquimarina]MDO5969176.1 acyltransferase family protein [Flavivirga aquimarina]
MNKSIIEKSRFNWIDQAKGLGIFLVIYAHNFPYLESYIYSFHMPLFFFISGMFHPKETNSKTIIHRAKSLLIPYFFWAFLLYLFWFFLGRHYGNSTTFNLDPIKSFIGIFYAQGGIQFMDWGIPLWFLPGIFLTFLLYSFLKVIKIKTIRYLVLITLISLGFLYPRYFDFKLPWSIDVACVSLVFYMSGNVLKEQLVKLNSNKLLIVMLFALILSLTIGFVNPKIDMYRAIYGNELLFIINGLTGTLFVLLFFKKFRILNFFAFLGKNTIVLLVMHFRALTFIKAILMVIGIQVFVFSEPIKFFISIFQVLLILPLIFLINKYAPIFNGKIKK